MKNHNHHSFVVRLIATKVDILDIISNIENIQVYFLCIFL